MHPEATPAPNLLLQAARKRLRSPTGSGRTLSRQELADAINQYTHAKAAGTGQRPPLVDAGYIGKYELGIHRWPDRLIREAFCAVLGVDDPASIGLYITRRSSPQDASERQRRTGELLPVGLDAGLSLTLAGDARPQTVTAQRATAVPTSQRWADMLRRTVLLAPPILAGQALAGTTTVRRQGTATDPNTVRAMVTMAAQYRRAYHVVPASSLLPAAQAHLGVVMSLRPEEQRGNERTLILTAAGEMAALAGVLLSLDAARHETALAYFDFAWAAARAAGDVELQTVVLGCRSFALANGGGDHVAGLECADFAREIGRDGACAQTRAWVAAVASERCASLGNAAGCEERLEESRTALCGGSAEEIPWRGVGGFNAAKLRAYEGGDLVRLRRFRDAEKLLDAALGDLGLDMPRHQATALIDRAEARLGAGEVDAACDDARRALDLVVQVQHTGHLDRLTTLAVAGASTGARSARTLQRDVRLAIADSGLPIG